MLHLALISEAAVQRAVEKGAAAWATVLERCDLLPLLGGNMFIASHLLGSVRLLW